MFLLLRLNLGTGWATTIDNYGLYSIWVITLKIVIVGCKVYTAQYSTIFISEKVQSEMKRIKI